VGLGYWGPNLVRNLHEVEDVEVKWLCDRRADALAKLKRRYPAVTCTTELGDVLDDPDVDAVVIATPVSTHHPLASLALRRGKHVFVEKPLAASSEEALDLMSTADDAGLVLMPGHTFLYSPPVNKVKELVANEALGEIYFVTSSRMNLGKYQADGVICDLAPHDLSILMHWLDEPVVQVSASARSVFQSDVPETAFITLTFESGTTANIQISWLAPRKVRQMVVVGSKRMIQYDDTASDEPIRIYDRGMDFSAGAPSSFGEYQLTYRSGDVVIPRVDPLEPLNLELADFARAVTTGSEPRSNAQLGLEIVKVIEAAEMSLRRAGSPIGLQTLSLAA